MTGSVLPHHWWHKVSRLSMRILRETEVRIGREESRRATCRSCLPRRFRTAKGATARPPALTQQTLSPSNQVNTKLNTSTVQ